MTSLTPGPAALGRWIARILRTGTLAAVGVTAIGYALAVSTGQPHDGPQPVAREVAGGGGDAVVAVGLLALTLLPVATLAAAVVAFHRAGERRAAATAGGVTMLLLASLAAAAMLARGI